MKKIGIVTLSGNFNYGNRLQNYALQKVLEKKGFEVETLEISFSRVSKVNKFMKALIRGCMSPSLIKKIFQKREYGKDFSEMSKLKSPKLLPFTKEYIRTRYIESENELSTVASQYDYFITGSDQVWNQSAMSDATFFLDFVPIEKRYSYAASFGKNSILNADKRYYKTNINGMREISVREFQGYSIVKDLTNRDAHVHLDPTMLLTAEEWRTLALQESFEWLPKKKFILRYVLRGMSETKEEELLEFKKKYNYEVITIMGDSIKEDNEILTVIQFLQAIDKAEFVMTDSFHGSVFSILLNTPFQVLERSTGNMNSRLDTLLEKFDLKQNSSKENVGLEKLLQTDFSKIEAILSSERQKSIDYLDSFLINKETINE
ncbi:polysaccharide pyruvyl transferase family protein [Enterococcus xiangfangensis]|uniref:Polysaccharide pyruvyl transferase family protein n=1 Tax=Enterococcus xiangfangensis TaxID=1296537 RepID=A0ABU3F7K6_9ENTE|nr:polysaccharide pyruvyl transferase family protein [Enterococcus xiangfangensis]MDT2758653.1 polysaccharide pyruvyl transferase family protein [Enterococcus xiangfangensis]NBK08309.1 polysaccharide pyruvyl transferase family protein [Enterococcus asini]